MELESQVMADSNIIYPERVFYDILGQVNYPMVHYTNPEHHELNILNNNMSKSDMNINSIEIINKNVEHMVKFPENMMPPLHKTVNYNNNVIKRYQPRESTRPRDNYRPISPKGYDSDESCTSYSSSRGTPPDNGLKYANTRCVMNKLGNQTLMFGKFSQSSPNVYHSNVHYPPNAQVHNNGHYNKNRCYTNSSSGNINHQNVRPKYNTQNKNNMDVMLRRAHGLVERFKSRAELMRIDPQPPSLLNGGHWDQLNQAIWDVYSTKAQKEKTYESKIILWKNIFLYIRVCYSLRLIHYQHNSDISDPNVNNFLYFLPRDIPWVKDSYLKMVGPKTHLECLLNVSLFYTEHPKFRDQIGKFKNEIMQKCLSNYGLFMVGSTMSGFGLESSDIDMCLLTKPCTNDPRLDSLHHLNAIRHLFVRYGLTVDSELILAKVPILKFKDKETGFEIDLNCNNSVGIRNTHLLHCYARLDWRVRPLVIIVKLWAQANNINDAKNMTVSSYSWALMVINYLQCGVTPAVLPCLHGLAPEKFNTETDNHTMDVQEEISFIKNFSSENTLCLGELLTGFFQYYSTFNYSQYAISVRAGRLLPVDECRFQKAPKNDPHQWKHLCIEEPFDLTNTARSVFDLDTFKHIRFLINRSFEELLNKKMLNNILPVCLDKVHS